MKILAFTVPLIFISCGQTEVISDTEGMNQNINLVEQLVQDSTQNTFLYSELKNSYRYDHYGLDENRIDSIEIFENDKKYQTEIFDEGNLVITTFYDDNLRIVYEILIKDSLFYSAISDDSLLCEELHLTYDQNGIIIEMGCQGTYDGTGMSVGTWYQYSHGIKTREILYHNANLGKDYIIYTDFDSHGKTNEIITNNFVLYEIDSIVLSNEDYLNRKGNF